MQEKGFPGKGGKSRERNAPTLLVTSPEPDTRPAESSREPVKATGVRCGPGGQGPVDRAYERGEGAEGSNTVGVRFIPEGLVVGKGLACGFASLHGAAGVDVVAPTVSMDNKVGCDRGNNTYKHIHIFTKMHTQYPELKLLADLKTRENTHTHTHTHTQDRAAKGQRAAGEKEEKGGGILCGFKDWKKPTSLH